MNIIERRQDKITSLATALMALPAEQHIECPVTHRFTPGCYLREIFMPTGTLIVGKIHKTEHFNIVLAGECLVATVEGIKHIKAPYTFVSAAGVQKVVYVIKDCIWQTTHVTEETDLDKIEAQVIATEHDPELVEQLVRRLA